MSNNQKDSSPLLEDERIQKELSKRFRSSRYWTLKKGIDFFLPREEDGSRFPLLGALKTFAFKTIKRDVETQNLETINSKEEIKEILAYDPVAEFEKIKSQRSPLRKVEMQWRNLQRYGSIDKERKLSFYEIQDDKIEFFCSNIKIKPEILICYIIDHIDLFSPEVEVPCWLACLIDDIQGPIKNNKGENREASDNKYSQYTFPGKQINSWNELEMVLISYTTVEIRTSKNKIRTSNDFQKLTFQQLGMANQQNPEKDKKVWQALMLFAELEGKYPNQDFPDANLENAKDRVKELNENLKQFFNLNDNIYKAHYKKKKCWELKFTISSRLEINPSHQADPSIVESEVERTKRLINLPESELYQE